MTNSQGNTENHSSETPKKLSLVQLIGSLFAGAVGVQSSKNRERDFESSSLMPFIIGGLIFTGLFVGGVIVLVNYLLASHGAS